MLVGSERGMRLTPGVMGGEVTPALQTVTAALIHSFIYVSIYSVRLEGRSSGVFFPRPVFTQIFRISFEMGTLASAQPGEGLVYGFCCRATFMSTSLLEEGDTILLPVGVSQITDSSVTLTVLSINLPLSNPLL